MLSAATHLKKYSNVLNKAFVLIILSTWIQSQQTFAEDSEITSETPTSKIESLLTTHEKNQDVLKEFSDTFEQDIPLKKISKIEVTNTRASVTIIGSSSGKIHIKVKRTVLSQNTVEAGALLKMVDLNISTRDDIISVTAEYGKGLSLGDKLKERKSPKLKLDLEVYAPSNLDLRAWANTGKIRLYNWKQNADLRTIEGDIEVTQSQLKDAALSCVSCLIQVENTSANKFKITTQNGKITLSQMVVKNIFSENQSGSTKLRDIDGNQTYVSAQGTLQGESLKGNIEFQTQDGDVTILRANGFLSGRSRQGKIKIESSSWNFNDKAFFETKTGTIDLSLPKNFSGEIDAWSIAGKTRNEFNLQPLKYTSVYGPEPSNHIRGRIGNETEQIRIFSDSGDISIKKTR